MAKEKTQKRWTAAKKWNAFIGVAEEEPLEDLSKKFNADISLLTKLHSEALLGIAMHIDPNYQPENPQASNCPQTRDFFDSYLAKLSPRTLKVFAWVLRHSIGWRIEWTSYETFSELCKKIHMNRHSLKKYIQECIENGLIIQDEQNGLFRFRLNRKNPLSIRLSETLNKFIDTAIPFLHPTQLKIALRLFCHNSDKHSKWPPYISYRCLGEELCIDKSNVIKYLQEGVKMGIFDKEKMGRGFLYKIGDNFLQVTSALSDKARRQKHNK